MSAIQISQARFSQNVLNEVPQPNDARKKELQAKVNDLLTALDSPTYQVRANALRDLRNLLDTTTDIGELVYLRGLLQAGRARSVEVRVRIDEQLMPRINKRLNGVAQLLLAIYELKQQVANLAVAQ